MKPYALCFAVLTSLTSAARAAETAPPAPAPLPCVTAETQTRSYYAAASVVEDKEALGGFAPSDNYPCYITTIKVQEGKLYLEADTAAAAVYRGGYQGIRLRLINTTARQVALDASDSSLPILMEARDGKDVWRPIEFISPAFCGNSDHRVFLGPSQYWEFTAPRFSGNYKTKLRFRQKGGAGLISNEFDGSIDERQFIAPPKK